MAAKFKGRANNAEAKQLTKFTSQCVVFLTPVDYEKKQFLLRWHRGRHCVILGSHIMPSLNPIQQNLHPEVQRSLNVFPISPP